MTENSWMQNTITEIIQLGELETQDTFLQVNSINQLKEKLTDIIAFLIDRNFEKLLWILYRIDVDEERAKALLSKHLPEDAPGILADLIIQRQLKKEEFRKQFHSAPAPDGVDDDLKL